ncbi:MAG: Holo-[acyl-carrier-protein] synthase [Marinimicrobia bacterium 46_43]|nr:MAG: Holo-[acyl-carrier-protein] synthase [Marinimicrobia bacterium 46_43]
MIETGIDIVEVSRVQQAITRHGNHFLKKIFHPEEITYCEAKTRKYEHYAARFAAKEACRKALLSHLSYHPAWTDMYIVNNPEGKPFLRLDEKIMKFLTIRYLSVSLSHTQTMATAIVFLDIGEK